MKSLDRIVRIQTQPQSVEESTYELTASQSSYSYKWEEGGAGQRTHTAARASLPL